jgi:DNA mismatch endonuclease (patch repair protein)
MLGRKHSAETRAKMGRPHSEESKDRLRARVFSPETRERMRESATRRYATMRALGQVKATKPELAVAAMLRGEGRTFIEQHPVEGFVVDFFLPDEHLVIEVNGCFWHGCARCGFAEKNPEVRRKDRQKAAALRRAGYALLVVWEHDL